MMRSLRRVSNSLLAFGIAALAAGTLYGITQFCADGNTTCLLASVGFSEPQFTVELPSTYASGSSMPVLPEAPSFWFTFFSFLQLTGVYVLLAGLIGLLVLEFFELHYIRQVRNLLQQQARVS